MKLEPLGDSAVVATLGSGIDAATLGAVLGLADALASAKRELIHDHIENCLQAPDDDAQAAAATLQELKALTKYL